MTPPIRSSLALGIALVLAAGAAWSIAQAQVRQTSVAVTRQGALDNIARRVLLPGYSDLAARSRELAAAVDALAAAPDAASLDGAQRTWRATLLAWRRTQAFAHGPIADLGLSNRIQFWPARRQSVDRVLRAERPIDDGYIQELGANAVGLSALEVLLFDPRLDDRGRVAAFSGPQAARQRRYAQALAQELSKRSREIELAWQGPTGYAAKFGAGGQQGLNLLVNDMLAALEIGAQGRLQTALDHRSDPQLHTDLVEGGMSGTSQQGVLALLQGVRAAFAGGDGEGLDDYLGRLNGATARRLDAQFRKAILAVQSIDGPLDQTVTTRAQVIADAHDACRALEILLKVEVVSTLGVTLTFKSIDGD
jgi:predicted lipoprotein